jgi:hypothetical protein
MIAIPRSRPAGEGGDYPGQDSPTAPGVGFAGAYVKADGSWGRRIGFAGFTAPNQQ